MEPTSSSQTKPKGPKVPTSPVVSQQVNSKLSQSYSALYLGSAMAGIARVLVGFPIEHPIDSVKTQWQAKPYLKNEFHAVYDIYQNKGIKGFYAGSLPNMTRVILKNVYRYPLMVGLPRFYNQNLPDAVKERKSVQKLLTGGSIALVEACITCPVERLKVFFMTTPHTEQKLTYKQFFTQYKGSLFYELFRGFTPLFMRQAVSWVVFLQADLMIKSQIRKRMGIREHEQIPTRYLMPASVLVALINTSFVIPFDCVKTHMEKKDPTLTYMNTFRTIYRQAGVFGFFTGIRLRFLLYLTNAIFAVNLLERLEAISNRLKSQ